MKTDVIVLGAGMIGTCTALQLIKRGHSVALLDRKAPGRETSFGNAGIIQTEAVEPYAFPRQWTKLFEVMAKGGADVNYHLSALPGIAPDLIRYWWNSGAKRYASICQAWSSLIRHAVTEHAPFIEEAGASDLVTKDGWLEVFRSQQALDREASIAERKYQQYGVPYKLLNSQQLAQMEPALSGRLAGAIQWTDPWPVRSPGDLVQRYAELFTQLGGQLLRGDAASLQPEGAGWSVTSSDGKVEAEQVVLALGPWSKRVAHQLGYRIPLFIKRGYHRHYKAPKMPNHPYLDVEVGAMLAPMVGGLRMTTGAEFAAMGDEPTPVQVTKSERRLREIIDLGAGIEAEPWMGNRPCMVDMKPVIGAAPRHKGLWFHFGHAHQGFTLGHASGRLMAELISGETPYEDPEPFSPARFS